MKKTLTTILLLTVASLTHAHYYIGIGVAGISGTSQNDKISTVTPALLSIGRTFSNHFSIEFSTTVSSPEDSDSNYKLKHSRALYLMGEYHLKSRFFLLGRAGLSYLEMTKPAGVLEANNSFSYGAGLRYQITNSIFADLTIDKLSKRTIDNRDEDFDQIGLSVKKWF